MNETTIFTPSEIDGMREAGALTAQCLREVGAMVVPGITTRALDDEVKHFCSRHKVESAVLNYEGFPAHCCTSVNHVVAHGVPNDRRLRSGDIVKIDIALRTRDGWHGDTCATFFVGLPCVRARAVVDAARATRDYVISRLAPGLTMGDIGWLTSKYARHYGCAAVHELGGHGIGRAMHTLPFVPNVGVQGEGVALLPGMCITIEPILNAGNRYIKRLADGSMVTRDRSWSAQFEHTVLITEDGYEILTQ